MLPKNINRGIRFSNCKSQPNETKVQSGLALTPAEMYTMAQQGKPISAQILPDDNFDDGEPQCSYDITLDRQRGIDVNDLWNAEKEINNKFTRYKSQNNISNATD